ncbi:hypothetical protein [Promicromonospora sp. NPDC060271]|uniref:hypothetical protein n=1 Tax=Promicromonospora sp. NPDC060271 TaxID=3347089 RepID=UPI00365D1C38
MSVRRFVSGAVAAVVAVAVAGCSVTAPARPPEASGAAKVGHYAYLTIDFGEDWMTTESQMVVMDGTTELGRSEPLFLADPPEFTTDGQYVFTVPTMLDEIVAISVDGGERVSVPCEGCGQAQLDCHCQVVAPIGGSQVAWLGNDRHLMIADLADEKAQPRRTGVTVPVKDGFLDEKIPPRLIAGTDGAALAAYPPSGLPGDDLLPVYLVTPDGEPRHLDTGHPDSVDEAAFSPDGGKVALYGNQEDACATVTVVDVGTGEGKSAPVHAAAGQRCREIDVYVDAMWWDPDGTLNVTYQKNRDANLAAGPTPPSSDGQRRLDGSRWVDAGDASGEVHQLSGGTAAIDDWKLTVSGGGDQAEIDTNVRYVTAAPR